ncbi:MAG: FAD-dependent oxidoreductase [Chloroflexota bacterium]
MKDKKISVIIVGAGIYGASTAVELQMRGHQVSLFDPGPLPHPEASSTDISKVLRMDYGKDEFYTDLMEDSFLRWAAWEKIWERPLYHETGFLMMTNSNWKAGGFEYDSYQIVKQRVNAVEEINADTLRTNYPAWNAEVYGQGYFNPKAGWAESGNVVRWLIEEGQKAGVQLQEGQSYKDLLDKGSKTIGIQTTEGEQFNADWVILAAGAWTPYLLPDLQEAMWVVGQPVLHFRPEKTSVYQPPHFLVWAADIARTGWYGFPATEDGILKVANHGDGIRVDPREEKIVPPKEEERFREFFAETFPSLVDAPKIDERLCLYCDTWDGDFWIDKDPNREGVIICTGGSGHGFKFAPMIGEITADVLENKPNKYAGRFAWRKPGTYKTEDARFRQP